MPYARVGAMPQPDNQSHPHQQNAGAHMGRQQGITMEDLKKQTALRLALEQQQHHTRGFELQQTDREMQILPPEHIHMHRQPNYSNHQNVVAVDANRSTAASAKIQGSIHNAENNHSSRHEMQSKMENANVNRNRKQFKSGRGNPSVTSPQGADWAQRNPKNSRPGSSSSRSSNSFDSASPDLTTQQQRKASSKAKLPHGLTVQELKEMTKARLQAEAETHEPDTLSPSLVYQSPPYGRDAREAASPVGIVQDPYVARDGIPAYSLSRNSATASGMPPGFQGRISPHLSNTPVPAVARFEGSIQLRGNLGILQGRDSWQQASGLDGWETTSVTSMNGSVGSEYLGSESAYSSGVAGFTGQHQDEMPGVPFNRSQSYGGAFEHHSSENMARAYSSGSPFSDFPDGQNRRRACTLSPRPGLSYLHEDRPLGTAATAGELPAFDTSGRTFPRVRTTSSDASYSESASHTSSPARLWTGQSSGVIGRGLFNRPRTASAPTVRSVSQPTNEFLGQGNTPLARLSSSHSLGMGVASPGAHGSDDYASVFRQTAGVGLSPRPPPGLFVNTESSASGFFSASGSRSNEFGVDDGWGRPSLSSRSFEHQVGSSNADVDASLADNLGSILKLSGARQSDSLMGEDTLVSRIDPEVDFNRNTSAHSPMSSNFSTISPSHGSREVFPRMRSASQNDAPRFP